MLQVERSYGFRSRIDVVHQKNMNDTDLPCQSDEIALDRNWSIILPDNADPAVTETAKDLADYFKTSMDLNIHIESSGTPGITFTVDPQSGLPAGAFILNVTGNQVNITASAPGGIRRGGIYLEDLCNLRGAAILKKGTTRREKLISPRILHSGWGIELFPDSHLNSMMHAGFDAVAVFCKGPNETNIGTLDFNDLIERAKKYDIEVYLYAYLPSFKHPDDDDAVEFFENVYTKLLVNYPEVAGVMLVGESAEFPSKDPATSGKNCHDSVVDGIPDVRPCPGWGPCSDYPAYLTRVRDAVRKAIPHAKIIFNTYNWGWTDLEVRKKFLENLPEGITIQVTYDIFSERRLFGQLSRVMDYSITAAKPGYYFESECQEAAKLGIPLLSTANTAGTTWDIGVAPYIPVPQRWITRFKELDRFRRECNLSAFYDNHHYGWWPSVITDLGRAYFNSPQCDLDELLKLLARRRAGNGANFLLEAWQKWSDAFEYLPITNEDQYGPLRVGAAYPFIFQPNITRTMDSKEIAFPADPKAHFGGSIIRTLYQPYENINQLPAALRYPVELKALDEFLRLWDEGLEIYPQAVAQAPESRKELLERELNLGKFIRSAVQTCRNIKEWYCLNRDLQNIKTAAEGLAILDQIEALAAKEIDNVHRTMPLVAVDSRLGWEPSMEYVGDQWHLEWKLRQVASALREISDYRKILQLQ
jgi:hypothetical protein